ncbi:hypothetical protein DCS_04793 [Drechmeria coniospora]|uniref:Uncharacterized protein n=1 Tax=Drechmeria coniospora TaxID=98403 RepID=A0A151GKY9_DRECN|nr:hypothetical protein DCS_04793 [Drechmeria coniospora]KYK57780.1 hypothetical protein DCS_04793 [Drechmeria coniospora]
MSMKQVGPIARAWFKWKALRLPWRKRFFVGSDLRGNTYWEFRLTSRAAVDTATSHSERWRRIVHYPRSTHYSDVVEPPSLEEQRADVVRQERVKVLAAEADARWEAKPRVMEDPGARAALSTADGTATHRSGPNEGEVEGEVEGEDQPEGQREGWPEHRPKDQRAAGKDDPWARARRAEGPSENWKPAAWSPAPAKKR